MKFFIYFFEVPDFLAVLSGWGSPDASCFTGELPVISTPSSSSSGVASGLMPFFGVKRVLMLDLFSAGYVGDEVGGIKGDFHDIFRNQVDFSGRLGRALGETGELDSRIWSLGTARD